MQGYHFLSTGPCAARRRLAVPMFHGDGSGRPGAGFGRDRADTVCVRESPEIVVECVIFFNNNHHVINLVGEFSHNLYASYFSLDFFFNNFIKILFSLRRTNFLRSFGTSNLLDRFHPEISA
jgi:hypothetical protein